MTQGQYLIKSLHFSNEEHNDLDAKLIGQKAIGLFNIPFQLVPPFVVLTSNLFNKGKSLSNECNSLLSDIVQECCDIFAKKDIKHFIIRSSAQDELFEERGFYESSKGDVSVENLYHSIVDVWEQNKEIFINSSSNNFSIIVQQYIKPKLFGHLSNERRIHRSSRQWLYEVENSFSRNRVKKFSVEEGNSLSPAFLCNNQTLLFKNLIKIASYWQAHKYIANKRYHLEWVWDQRRIWIVQNDIQDNSRSGSEPGSEWSLHLTNITGEHNLTCFDTLSTTTTNWKKIDCVKTFKNCSLPYGSVYILEDDLLLEQISRSIITDKLIADLNWLLQTPIVIRMDIKGGDNTLLPRTETIFDLEQAIKFLIIHSQKFLNNYANSKFCFLIHRFIVSKSCALAFSKPSNPKIRIDSTWGIVDGLHYHTHDSFEIDREKKTTRKIIRCKTEYVDVNNTGGWYSRKSGADWDWAESLTRQQATEISNYTSRIAEHLQKPVTVMYFVDVNPATGYSSIMPWFYSTDDVLEVSEGHFKDRIFAYTKVLVQDKASFDILKNKVNTEGKFTIKLKLSVDIVRAKSLIEEIGAFACANNIAIELEGSILAHPYYILKKQGAKVKVVEDFAERKQKQIFNKLVRDKIPENIAAKGEKVEVKLIPSELRLIFLKRKIIEEAYEFFWEKKQEKQLEELADLYEVIRSICKEMNISLDELIHIADLKNDQKGGFDRGLFLSKTEKLPLFQSTSPSSDYSLFDDEYNSSISNRQTSRKNDILQDILLVPYIPSIDINSAQLTRFFSNQNVDIYYTEQGIRIRLSLRSKDPNQLSLF